MRSVFLTTDGREFFRNYGRETPWFGTAPQALLEGFSKLGSEIEVHVVSCTQHPVASPKKLADNIWFHSLHVPKMGWLRTGYQGCVRAVREKLKEIQPDIVHAQGTERDCAISSVLSPYPRILTIHGNLRLIKKQVGFSPFSALWFQSFLEGRVVPRFDGVICITKYTREAVDHEVPKTWVVPNAVDPDFLALGAKRFRKITREVDPDIDNSGFKYQVSGLIALPIILVVGTIDERKNQNAFIKALESLAGRVPFQVRFFGKCGDDEYGAAFQGLIAEREWCHYGGMIGREELKKEFGTASMLALPTHEDNCPMVVLEAMAAGVPVMASRVGGVPDLIDGISTGLFCDPLDPESFRIGVKKLLEDREFAQRMASTAYEDAVKRFHPNVIASKHLEIYRDVLSEKLKKHGSPHG